MRPHAEEHAAVLGALIADDLATAGCSAFVVDPVVVDESEPCAKLSGLAGIERRSVFHALNTKSVVRKAAAKSLVLPTRTGDLSPCIWAVESLCPAHRYGRVIYVNDAMGGDGPFTPDRSPLTASRADYPDGVSGNRPTSRCGNSSPRRAARSSYPAQTICVRWKQ